MQSNPEISHRHLMLTTRAAITGDIPLLQELIARSVRGLSTGHYSAGQIESAIRYIFGVDSQLLIDQTYYVVQTEEKIVACGGWSKRNTLYGGDQHKNIEDPLLDPKTDPSRIRAFFVDPAWARRGIGRMLIGVCENAAIEYGFKTMILGATLPGVPLYKALGYDVVVKELSVMPNGVALEVVKMQKQLVPW